MRQGNFENLLLPDEEPINEEIAKEQKPKRKPVNIPLLEIEAETKLAHRGEVIGHDDDLKEELRVHNIVKQPLFEEKMEDVYETVSMVFEKINSLRMQLGVHEETLQGVYGDIDKLKQQIWDLDNAAFDTSFAGAMREDEAKLFTKKMLAKKSILEKDIVLLEEYYEKLSLYTEKIRKNATTLIDRLESLVSYSHKKADPKDTSKDPLMNKTFHQN